MINSKINYSIHKSPTYRCRDKELQIEMVIFGRTDFFYHNGKRKQKKLCSRFVFFKYIIIIFLNRAKSINNRI